MNNTYHNILSKFGQVVNESILLDKDAYIKAINNVAEPITGNVSVSDIKQFLMDTFNASSWKEFISEQSYGTCAELASLVSTKFPSVKVVVGDGKISKTAKTKLKVKDIAGQYFVHYFNKIGDQYVDFGKGTNTENGTYLLAGLGKPLDVELTDAEISQYDKIKVVDVEKILED